MLQQASQLNRVCLISITGPNVWNSLSGQLRRISDSGWSILQALTKDRTVFPILS